MSFGKNLQYLRQLSAGMTQEALAERLNVSRQTISKWEMDAANPEMDKALELCKVFNCTLDDLSGLKWISTAVLTRIFGWKWSPDSGMWSILSSAQSQRPTLWTGYSNTRKIKGMNTRK